MKEVNSESLYKYHEESFYHIVFIKKEKESKQVFEMLCTSWLTRLHKKKFAS